ncbi:hypothetical protein RA277_27635 [Pseudomonas syringae pv. tagetis]
MGLVGVGFGGVVLWVGVLVVCVWGCGFGFVWGWAACGFVVWVCCCWGVCGCVCFGCFGGCYCGVCLCGVGWGG